MTSTQVWFVEGQGGLPCLRVENGLAEAKVYFQGAHVTHFQPHHQCPVLFMSGASRYENNHPIRGGVPVIFPWFGPKEGEVAHGVVRNQAWRLDHFDVTAEGATQIHFRFPAELLPAAFQALQVSYRVEMAAALTLELQVHNNGTQAVTYEDCLHTYFAIGDVRQIEVTGLKGVEYLDKCDSLRRKMETEASIRITGETDRVYLNTTSRVEIHDPVWKRKITVDKQGSKSTVIWNPWKAKAKTMADFGDEEYPHMICVESGNVGENAVTLAAGQRATLQQKISLQT